MEPYVSLVGESIRHLTPGGAACRLGCRSPCSKEQANFVPSDTSNVISNLSSNWIESGTVLAMARPAEPFMSGLIREFGRNGIRSVFNLQMHGEHEYCGKLVDGFTYRPETLMAAGISYYNFPTDDFGIWPVDHLLNIVKVVSFAAAEGGVAIHCHAGLGRTGVIAACWLTFDRGLKAEEAIVQVRKTRKGAIQTRQQLASVANFESVLRQLRLWPNSSTSLEHIHRCYVKSYNKHEFGKNPEAPPLLLKIKKIVLEKAFNPAETEPNDNEQTIDRVKNGAWTFLHLLNRKSLADLLLCWLEGFPLALLSDSRSESNVGLPLTTARTASDIFTLLHVSNSAIVRALFRSDAVNSEFVQCLAN